MIHSNCTIQSQSLSKSRNDEDVVVSSEEVYRKNTEAMFNMNRTILNEKHKSHYTDTDIDVLNECRTIVQSGTLILQTEEIYVNKAFTKAFTSIKRISMLMQFDIWREWNETLNINDMPSSTLYVAEVADANMMFSKKHNLIYGKFLKK